MWRQRQRSQCYFFFNPVSCILARTSKVNIVIEKVHRNVVNFCQMKNCRLQQHLAEGFFFFFSLQGRFCSMKFLIYLFNFMVLLLSEMTEMRTWKWIIQIWLKQFGLFNRRLDLCVLLFQYQPCFFANKPYCRLQWLV